MADGYNLGDSSERSLANSYLILLTAHISRLR